MVLGYWHYMYSSEEKISKPDFPEEFSTGFSEYLGWWEWTREYERLAQTRIYDDTQQSTRSS